MPNVPFSQKYFPLSPVRVSSCFFVSLAGCWTLEGQLVMSAYLAMKRCQAHSQNLGLLSERMVWYRRGNSCAWSAQCIWPMMFMISSTMCLILLGGVWMKMPGADALPMAGNANLGSDGEHIQWLFGIWRDLDRLAELPEVNKMTLNIMDVFEVWRI